MDKDEKLFYDNMNRFHAMIASFCAKDAMVYLVDASVFESVVAGYAYLENFPSVDKAIHALPATTPHFPGFDDSFTSEMHRRMLDSLLSIAVNTKQMEHVYLDTISIACNCLSSDYEYIESNYYLADKLLPQLIDDIEKTLLKFPYENIDDLEELYVKDLLTYYLQYLETCGCENTMDKNLLSRIKKIFPKENIPNFTNKTLVNIDFIQLSSCMEDVSYHTKGYYYPKRKEFYIAEEQCFYQDFMYEDDKENRYEITLDKKEILKRFLDTLSNE